MSYIRAEEVLPKELLASVQQYVDGPHPHADWSDSWGNDFCAR